MSNTKILPREMLHPRIEKEVWPNFLRGRYDLAIFAAFREIEVEVRTFCGYEPELVGTGLMRKAFEPEKGPLAPIALPKAEQEALAHLFAGAIGFYKNPASHRIVGMEPEQAASILLFASHLMSTLQGRMAPDRADGG